MRHQQMTSIEPQTPGRIVVGSVNHCMHGPGLIVEHVADWRPFSYYTTDYPMEHTLAKASSGGTRWSSKGPTRGRS